MSGIEVIREILCADAAVLALVPEDRIVADVLPEGVALPALSIEHIGGVDRKVLKPGVKTRVVDRVQVMIHAADATDRLALAKAVKRAGAGKVGDWAGVTEVSVQTDGQGPDLTSESDVKMRPQDFLVSCNELT